MTNVPVDWPVLRAAAHEAMGHAYVPYSRFPVGVAGLADDGRIVVGCNVENASYGLTLCAECGMVSALHAGGGGRLVAVACVDAGGAPLMPCGRCRQLLWEHGGPGCLVDHPDGPLPMSALLPYAFDDTDLAAVQAGRGGRTIGDLPVPAGPDAAAGALPAALRRHRGQGTVFLHPDVAGGVRVWTGYWDGSSAGLAPEPGERAAILQEAPNWTAVEEGVAWARARTWRVVVVDADGGTWWAGAGEPPATIGRRWPGSDDLDRSGWEEDL